MKLIRQPCPIFRSTAKCLTDDLMLFVVLQKSHTREINQRPADSCAANPSIYRGALTYVGSRLSKAAIISSTQSGSLL